MPPRQENHKWIKKIFKNFAKTLDKQKNVYEKHPQTGETIKGFKFPYWNEAIELCKKACQEIPEMGYVGWDVAFTPEGPLFVEANEFPRT